MALIDIENLCVSYGQNQALENVNMHIEKGEYLGIIGPNGGGKTTLLSAMLGLVRTSSGTVRLCGGEVAKNRSRVGYVPQIAAVDRNFPISVMETVMTAYLKDGFHPFKKYTNKERESALLSLSRVGISDLSQRRISDLSGGEFQRLLIARAMAAEPEILLLDEPTASVDPVSREKIYDVLKDANADGVTVIMVTHDLLAVSSSVKKIACLNKRLVYHGEVRITQEISDAMYGCPVDLIAHGVPHRVLGHHHEGGECCD